MLKFIKKLHFFKLRKEKYEGYIKKHCTIPRIKKLTKKFLSLIKT